MLIALALVGVGKDAQATARATEPQTDTHTAATAAVTAVGFLCVGGTQQQYVTRSIQRRIATGFELAALHHDIAAVRWVPITGRIDGYIVACRQGRTGHAGLFLMLL
ncbi:Uncharacterised protein [Yersinia frederiksenii]|nr:Uncharacterised protein [Yersinia frederiksenii]